MTTETKTLLRNLLGYIGTAYDATNDIKWVADGNIIAFRGSEDNDDWNTNFDIVMTPYEFEMSHMLLPGGEVHDGFHTRWKELRHEIHTHVSKFTDVNSPLIVTGHSLGGAIATLCALDLAISGLHTKLVVFGSPRVGNDDFVRLVNHVVNDHIRVENWGDPVPRVPPLSVGYRHAGKSMRVGSIKNLIKFPHFQHHGREVYLKEVS